ncbi:MAG: HD domain-containing protein [Nitrospinota bacterium]|nr:HD domain-containing protein [Nitrospinota bacterium]
MNNNSLLSENLTDIARDFFKGIYGAHGWDHVQRVLALCRTLGPMEGCDMETLTAAALLHDIGRKECDMENGARCHAAVGAQIASSILTDMGLDREFIEKVVHCVASHRYRGGLAPVSIEAKTLYDADKLDSIGAVGVGRAFQFAGEVGAKLHDSSIDPRTTEAYGPDDTAWREYMVKLRYIKDNMMTAAGAAMASERARYMDEFFERLDREANGLL